MLIYFIHHIATQIQLPQVIASIAKDLAQAVAIQSADRPRSATDPPADAPSPDELLDKIDTSGAVIRTPKSGYLQYIRHQTLIRIATEADAVIRLPYRPGHFLVEGRELASAWPPEAAERVARYLARAQATGPHRTLTQDVAFGVDQLVEIALRALSPAVNDTFTALTCIDWLGDCLCKIAPVWTPTQVHRDRNGYVRVISDQVSYERLVQRAFEKVRQAGPGMPAVLIRQLDALTTIMEQTTDPERAAVLMDQAAMIQRANIQFVPDESDRADVDRRYEALKAIHDGLYNKPQDSVNMTRFCVQIAQPLPSTGLAALQSDRSLWPRQRSHIHHAQGSQHAMTRTYDLVHTVLRDTRFAMPQGIGLVVQGITSGPSLGPGHQAADQFDGAEHHRLRRLVSRAFTPRTALRMRAACVDVITELIEAHTAAGRCDFLSARLDIASASFLCQCSAEPTR